MPSRRLQKRIRSTRPRTHLEAPFRRIAQAVAHIITPRHRARPARG